MYVYLSHLSICSIHLFLGRTVQIPSGPNLSGLVGVVGAVVVVVEVEDALDLKVDE